MKLLVLLPLFVFACSSERHVERRVLPEPPRTAPVQHKPDTTDTIETELEPIVLGTADTFLRNIGDQKDRAFNVQLAAALIDQVEVTPGEEFSFNATVGPRSAERGFRMAPTILLGEVVPDLGGGTCQVSSTLFAAVLDAHLEVTSRRPHSRVPKYTLPGLDATVSYPIDCQAGGNPDPAACVDFRFKNTMDQPIVIEARVTQVLPGKARVRVEILGTAWWRGQTMIRWAQFGTKEFEKRARKLERKAEDYKARKQKGEPGITGALLVRQETMTGDVRELRIRSTYKPVDEIWEVGPGWDDALNPWDPR